jgi:hypothetical protein
MKSILILLLLVTGLTKAQETEFKFSKDGFTNFVVTETPNFRANEIYSKTLNWIKENYENPNEVIKMTIENESIRLTAIENIFRIYNAFGDYVDFPLEYSLKISFKENKYKFEVTIINVKHNAIDYSNIPKMIYKKNGILIKWYRDTPTMIENYFNELNSSLKNYILEFNKKENQDW